MTDKNTYEHTFQMYQVKDGPKVMIESLNTLGQEGWSLATVMNIGTDRLIAFLVRDTTKESPNPKKADLDKTVALWSATGESDDE